MKEFVLHSWPGTMVCSREIGLLVNIRNSVMKQKLPSCFTIFMEGKKVLFGTKSQSPAMILLILCLMGLSAKIFFNFCVKAQSAMFATKSYALVANEHKSSNLASTTKT